MLTLFKLLIAFHLLLTCPCLASSTFSELKYQQFHSQADQDYFVYLLLYRLLDKQDAGYYLEIGAGHPSDINNSLFFEKNFDWKGVSIDVSNTYKTMWDSTRKNPLLIEDARKSDYTSILSSFPYVIDYLSLDIDADYDIVLKRIPFNDHIFKIITIEHDFYKFGDTYREKERKILASMGYYLLCPDVSAFEDWWIHPSAFPSDVFSMLASLDLNGKLNAQVLNSIRNYLIVKGIPF